MDLQKLNKLINRITFLHNYLKSNGNDALLEERLYDYMSDLRTTFGEYLLSQLFEVYDEYFEDNELESLENYIYGDTMVHGEEFDQSGLRVKIKSSPLRIELSSRTDDYRNTIWQATWPLECD